MFEELKEYVKQNNTTQVKQGSNRTLYSWMYHQKETYKKFKAQDLDKEDSHYDEKIRRCQLLESIGFDEHLILKRRKRMREDSSSSAQDDISNDTQSECASSTSSSDHTSNIDDDVEEIREISTRTDGEQVVKCICIPVEKPDDVKPPTYEDIEFLRTATCTSGVWI